MSTLARINTATSHLKNLLFLGGFIVALFSALSSVAGVLFFTFAWPKVVAQLKLDLDVASRADIEEIKADLRELSGENKIFKELPGTYIVEPVTQGDGIQMIFNIARTEYGLPCVFLDGIPLFSDERDIPFPGGKILPIKQVDTNGDRLPLILQAPDNLQPGRITVVLSMHYSCPFGREGAMVDVFQESNPYPFQMVAPQYIAE